MNTLLVLSLFIASAYAGGAPYSFGYATADGQSRSETGVGGAVTGQYSYVDANGDLRKVAYVADALGYRPVGDVSVDRKTAAYAAGMATLAPKGTVHDIGRYAVGVAPYTAGSIVAPQVAHLGYAGWGGHLAAPLAAPLAIGHGYGLGLGYGYGAKHW